ncbi:hypothetical protein [Streptomyces gobiensis]|uniref:hypothetical protein n=1 Tax=Streptomyces gobiensis TaxID=2875706 RepID=UPI001E6463F1|nr:hypothetical protein [Streptomyces gobiensis]UGY91030.1 hypothetical protein test1122_04350 [Streptomyces gobiensis]
MTSAPRSLSRAIRAALFAAVCVVLAAAGHTAMSGHDTPLRTLLAALAVTGSVAWLGGHRRRGPMTIGGGLLAVQTALHLLFAATRMPMAPPAHGTHLTHPTHHVSLGMLAAHLLTALCCALWLWRGEVVFFRLLRALHALALPPLALRPVPAALPETAAPLVRTGRTAARPHTVRLAHTLSRRGPPGNAALSA